MPKISCICGGIINLSPIPNRQGFKLLWEPLIEKLADNLVAAHQQAESDDDFENKVYELLYPRSWEPANPQVYECFHCKRLAVLARASDREITFWYQQELANTETDSLRSLVEKTIDNQTDEA
ncbi:hypothetical protein [Nostoc sp. PCC 7107]|uniref:hypothetical protein n=1 Tax=Nostoc sp. PCC 7107 TaxID=317936 RepID=UPI00029F2046|nr:hypothetical protein [Nostoc sp. PCC 7107]AFY41154.1 hypothetical protein Nos7107_0481 [Nostoc sp. PCC 7107]